ncbi:MAG: hypothetical protein EBU90_22610 [Proteobacteria bacterium]|nr:hypothetical protein [Pseudomonadota bacterium]
MSVVQHMGDHIRERIYSYAHALFETLGFKLDKQNIWHDFAEVRPQFFKSTFYVTDIDNVKRSDFNALSTSLKQNYPELKEFKVKFKRPDKPVRFYIEINTNS